ncbi:protein of unknown function DUF255 [Candidatus Magnetoovum chiemensis]|nr:protein of unknown function DUF255 [Candidatus Magnetoovum chiemensis]
MEDKKYNNLINEKSPYLLQHAKNPVDWYPWCEEAFDQAKKQGKPIFLSIGYSTCHWCHVMEKECFEDDEVAQLMNSAFISIKLDREERPDIDNVYMTIAQMMTGRGGWPLTIIMTPDKKPFFAATYIPKHSRFGMMGMLELTPHIKRLWENKKYELLNVSEKVYNRLNDISTHQTSGKGVKEDTLHKAYENLSKSYDEQYGGFNEAPKFPSPHNFLFLLRYFNKTSNDKALEMVVNSLKHIRLGGMCDHIGFGFHRYSTDRQWLVPHFEKMLYDQALLAIAYTEAYQATGKTLFMETACEIFTYALRDMRDGEGAFYCAEDADSEGIEGKFYVWSSEEIEKLLTPQEAQIAQTIFNVKKTGNYHDEATGNHSSNNILHLQKPLNEISNDLNIPLTDLKNSLNNIREKLFIERKKRPHPHKDDKILTDWNGLIIAALSIGARVYDNPLYMDAALKAANFILNNMTTKDNTLLHRFRQGSADIAGMVDDYAFFIWALIELYESTFDVKFLKKALELTDRQLESFWDNENGGLYLSKKEEEVLIRQKEAYDAAVPSGNSVSMLNLLRLAKITGRHDYEEKASKISQAFSNAVNQTPTAFTYLLCAIVFAIEPSYEIVITGQTASKNTKEMLRALRTHFIPNKVTLFKQENKINQDIEEIVKYIETYQPINNKTTAYICSNYTCNEPTNDISKIIELKNIKSANFQ